MRILTSLFLLCTIVYYAPSAYSQESTPPVKESTNASEEKKEEAVKKDPVPDKKVKPISYPYGFIEANVSYGLTYPSGQIMGNNISRVAQTVYGGGFTVGGEYAPFLGLSVGFEYLDATMRLDKTFAGSPTITTNEIEFINCMIGYYTTWKTFYGEIGYYYGLAAFDWERTIKCNGIQTVETIPGGEKKDTQGFYYGAGIFYNFSDAFYLKIGFRIEQAFTPAISNQDKICPYLYMIKAGFEYRISL
jgi:opacity protein-like surface antigen